MIQFRRNKQSVPTELALAETMVALVRDELVLLRAGYALEDVAKMPRDHAMIRADVVRSLDRF